MTACNVENMRTWVAALRSGEYFQGKGDLRYEHFFDEGGSEVRYCCLGVAADLAVKAGVPETFNDGPEGDPWTYSIWDSADLTPPVQEWLGITEGNPILANSSGDARSAVYWNDDAGATFAEIADMVEKEYLLTQPEGSTIG